MPANHETNFDDAPQDSEAPFEAMQDLPAGPHCTAILKHMGAPALSGGGKVLGVAGVIFEAGGSSSIAFPVGGVLGAANAYVDYYYVTKAAAHAGSDQVLRAPSAEALTWGDESKAFIIFASSLGQGATDGYKAYLKTGGMLPMAIPAALIGQVSHFQANGQKCFFDTTGKDINASLIGQMNRLFTLDFKLITENLIDIKSLVTAWLPEYEVALQISAVINAANLVGISQPFILASLAAYSAYAVYYQYKGYGQRVMQENFGVDGRAHHGFAALINSSATVISKGVNGIATVPSDVILGVIASPKVVLTGSMVAGAVTSGYATFYEGFSRLPPTFAEHLQALPAWGAGAIGAALTTWATTSQFVASWQQKLVCQQETKDIGVEPIVIERFGNSRFSLWPSAIADRAKSYGSYVQSQVSSCCGFFSRSKTDTPSLVPVEKTSEKAEALSPSPV